MSASSSCRASLLSQGVKHSVVELVAECVDSIMIECVHGVLSCLTDVGTKSGVLRCSTHHHIKRELCCRISRSFLR